MSADGVFDERIARTYDGDSASMFAPEVIDPTVDFLAELADGRRVLEFAIGTGRVGLPLSATGVNVTGIELSEAMVAVMMAKPGADSIPVTIGDMATVRAGGTFGLVYLVYNTIAPSPAGRDPGCVRCFRRPRRSRRVRHRQPNTDLSPLLDQRRSSRHVGLAAPICMACRV